MQGTTSKSASDLYLDLKEIKLEINKFKAEKEVAKREVEEYQSALGALHTEFKEKTGIEDLQNAVLENIINNRLRYNIDKYEKDLSKLSSQIIDKEETLKKLIINLQRLSKEFKDKFEEFTKLEKESESLRQEHNLFIKDKTAQSERLLSNLQKLRIEIETARKQLADYNSEYLEKRTFIFQEETRLANKGSDLHIYEARLRKKYLELMPGIEIVV